MLEGFSQSIIDIFFPKRCPACRRALDKLAVYALICPDCWANIKFTAGTVDLSCENKSLGFDQAFSPCLYTGTIKELIQAFKYSGQKKLGVPLGEILVKFIRDSRLTIQEIDALIPIPLHPSRLREREFNQALVLAQSVARAFTLPLEDKCIIRQRETKTQADLPAEKRLDNVTGCFKIKEPFRLSGSHVLLIDDVLTSGATASECARTLKNAGVKKISLLTVAH